MASQLDELTDTLGSQAYTAHITGLALMAEAAHAWSRRDFGRSLELHESSSSYWRTDVPIQVITEAGTDTSD